MTKGKGRGRGRGRGRGARVQNEETRPGSAVKDEERPADQQHLGQRQNGDQNTQVPVSCKTEIPVSDKGANANGLRFMSDERVNLPATKPVESVAKDVQMAETRIGTASVVARPKEETPLNPAATTTATKIESENKADQRQEKATKQLTEKISALSINKVGASSESAKLRNGGVSTQLLKRPNFGAAGRRIRLKANFVPVQIPEHGDIYHYDVAILPEKCPRKVNQEIVAKMVQEYQRIFKKEKPVFDGKKNLYSKQPLPIGNNSQEFVVKIPSDFPEKEREFKVTIKQVARVSLQALADGLRGRADIPKDTIQALEVVLRMAPSARYIPVGRSFFSEPEPGTAINLGNGCEMWYGSYQSIRPTQWGMMLNIDHATTAFYKSQPVIDYLRECNARTDLNKELRDAERKQFERKIKGLKVEFTYIRNQRRQKRIVGIAKESANNLKFEMDTDGKKRQITVARYFQETYKISLRYPNLQCLKAGSDKNCVHLPMELCTLVPGQRCMKKLDEGQTAKMIRETAKDAMDRKGKIEKKVVEANFDVDPFLKDFGMSVGKSLVSIEGRVLNPPPIQLAKESSVVIPRDGKWDMRNAAFFQGQKIDNWALIVCANERFCNEGIVRKFCNDLNMTSISLNMPISRNPSFMKYLGRENLHKMFEDIIEKVGGLQLVLVILDGGLYAEVKSLADTHFGIITQCILCKNVKKCNRQLLANLCMKINAKLAGVNGFFSDLDQRKKVYRPLKVFSKPVIFLGADVTHPSPGDTTKPSIAAVVGSIDALPMKYAARVKAQGHRKEIIADLTSMTKELLKEFNKATRHQPEKIIMYRDGVSEGQFAQVLHFELEAVRNACRELSSTYRPDITFITVQKRHHVRLFAEDTRDQVGKSRNIPAGTVVDRSICHPSEFDFYLCSHNGIQGTSRPSHYRILWDDSKFTADELQQLTYALCHNYARCTRSVSIPPPAYYAHHVAMRANYHIQAMESSSFGSSSESQVGSANLDALNKNLESAIKIHNNLLSKMYFI